MTPESPMRLICSLLLLLAATTARADEPPRVKILMLGNSYTQGVKGPFEAMLRAGGIDPSTALRVVVHGGYTLAQHEAEPLCGKMIATGRWTHVVLQEQSQHPAYAPTLRARYVRAVKSLESRITAANAKTVLFTTWGYLDGDKRNPTVAPDYATMQKLLSEGFREAERQVPRPLVVAPIDVAWAAVRKRDPALGKRLYAADGSHPAAAGAHLAAWILYRTIVGKDPKPLRAKQMSEADAKILAEEAAKAVAARAKSSPGSAPESK